MLCLMMKSFEIESSILNLPNYVCYIQEAADRPFLHFSVTLILRKARNHTFGYVHQEHLEEL